jgi:thiamine biosynthesis lipoprotein ApbE
MIEITRTHTGPGGERRRRSPHPDGFALRLTPPSGHRAHAEQRLDQAEALLTDLLARLDHASHNSELRTLNEDPRSVVPASPMLLRFAEAVSWAGRRSGGLVDATTGPFPGAWRDVAASGSAIHRPVGVQLLSAELGRALAADLAAEVLRGAPSWLVDGHSDLRIGGAARRPRPVDIHDPLDPAVTLHRLHITSGGAATRTRRPGASDPRDEPTGDAARELVQATALAPTALEAAVLASAALRTAGDAAHRVLEHGGVLVHGSGVVEVIAPPAVRRHDRWREAPRLRIGLPAAA